MALKGLFKPKKQEDPPSPWHPQGPYPALFSDMTPEPVSGVFAFWHLGVRPQWVFVGGAGDLSAAAEAARQDPDLLAYDQNGGVYMAWVPLEMDVVPGVIFHLRGELLPAISDSPLEALCAVPEGTLPLSFPAPEERLPEEG